MATSLPVHHQAIGNDDKSCTALIRPTPRIKNKCYKKDWNHLWPFSSARNRILRRNELEQLIEFNMHVNSFICFSRQRFSLQVMQ